MTAPDGRPGVWIEQSEAVRLHETDLTLEVRERQVSELTRQIERLEAVECPDPDGGSDMWLTVSAVAVGLAAGVIAGVAIAN